jgi:uncharacterized phage protein (TIGR01671 family)
VEGYYVKTRLGTDIKPSDVIFVPFKINRNEEWGWIKIDPETLCQYTGLTDKNGKKIWENDIAECNKRKEECGLYKVIWRKEYADFGVVPISNTCIGRYPIGFSCGKTLHGRDYKKVGNVFDNPELLEVK